MRIGAATPVLRRSMLVACLAFATSPWSLMQARATEAAMYLVLFEGDDTIFNEAQKAILDHVIADYRPYKGAEITVDGNYERTGNPAHRMEMSRRYAEAVRDYLVAGGVPESSIVVSWHGDMELSAPTADGVHEQANRNVVIVFVPVGNGS